jgi:hypothetical protein
MTPAETKLLSHIILDLVENGVRLTLVPDEKVVIEDGGDCFGYFQEEDLEIEVATKREDWLHVLAHEYCHFKQFQEGIFDDPMMIAAYSAYDPWVSGKREFLSPLVESFCRKMQWLEKNNEERTVALLDEFKVEYDRELYIRKANVYVLTYEVSRRLRRHQNHPVWGRYPEVGAMVPGDRFLSESEFGDLPSGFMSTVVSSFDEADTGEEE